MERQKETERDEGDDERGAGGALKIKQEIKKRVDRV